MDFRMITVLFSALLVIISHATLTSGCDEGEFACAGDCVPDIWRCDGQEDCSDGADEQGCGDITCSSRQFRCGDGACISSVWTCDGNNQCEDGSDEINCEKKKCLPSQHSCDGGFRCVDKNRLCDVHYDCRDASDETNCESRQCPEGEYNCEGIYCISNSSVCDGFPHCGDFSDEHNCATCQPGVIRCADGTCMPPYGSCDEKVLEAAA